MADTKINTEITISFFVPLISYSLIILFYLFIYSASLSSLETKQKNKPVLTLKCLRAVLALGECFDAALI